MEKRLILVMALALALAAMGLAIACLCAPAQDSAAPPARMTELGLMLLEEEDGVYVLAVTDRSPACRAGIEPGDLLTGVDGESLTEIAQLEAMLQHVPEGGALRLGLVRNGASMTLTLPVQ